MIAERTLRRWRKDSLKDNASHESIPKEGMNIYIVQRIELNNRILRLTQELLDQHILRKR